ncbi:MAG: ImmA/IrrE family metallo-endopeptidase [Christensenella sp.]|nr:ImmA/IrrE family metallo-endopeptidase [Christensenella sp.]
MQYMCQPLSRIQLREYARSIRKALKLDKCAWLPAVKLLEGFHRVLEDEDFNVEIVDDDYFTNGTHAAYFPEENCIRVRNSVYEGACNNCGRDRMTIVHELAHVFLLRVSSVQFSRCFDEKTMPTYCDPEWQAKCLAGELMMPYYLVGTQTAAEIAENCGVSWQAAEFQKSKYK